MHHHDPLENLDREMDDRAQARGRMIIGAFILVVVVGALCVLDPSPLSRLASKLVLVMTCIGWIPALFMGGKAMVNDLRRDLAVPPVTPNFGRFVSVTCLITLLYWLGCLTGWALR